MKIVYIAAGAAGMYCGSCLHDNTLAAALRRRGEDVLLTPTYTPTRTDEPNESIGRVFFGGINVYLQQQMALFRRTPWLLDRLLDHPPLVAWLAERGAASVRPEDLGPLTVSMLRGERGNQRKEVDKLVHWLAEEIRPDVVHLSNSMLLGMAHSIRQRLGIPVLCSLSGEDIFLEKLVEPYYSQARQLLRERARDCAAFVALNQYYANFMADYLAAPASQVHVIRHGLNLEGFGPRPPRSSQQSRVVGYFARVCPEKGLHHLVEAIGLLADDPALHDIRLHAAGYLGAQDRPYLAEIRRRADALGLAGRFEYRGELDRAKKIAFLQSLDVFSVPTVYRESKGISALEAMACGIPVVLPEHGAFPEYVADTEGGLLHVPKDPADLADKLRTLLTDPAWADEMGRRGWRAIVDRFTAAQMADQTLTLYRQLTGQEPPGGGTQLAGGTPTIQVQP